MDMIKLDDMTNGFWLSSEYGEEPESSWVKFREDLLQRYGFAYINHIESELAEAGAILIKFNVNGLTDEEEWLYEDAIQGFVKFESSEALSMFRLRWT